METPHWPAVVMQILIARHWLLMLLKVNIMSHHMNFPHHRYANVYLSGNFSISERIKVKAKRTLYTFLFKVMHFHLWWTLFIYDDFMIYFCNILKTISVSDFPSAHEAPTQAGRHRDNQVEVKKIVFYHLNTIMIWCPLRFRVSQSQDYPVDLYYLMDLSNSMSDDKENIVR